MLRRVQMNVWTLQFGDAYERAYVAHLHDSAVKRIRYALALGVAFLLLKALYEHASTTAVAHDEPRKVAVTVQLAFAVPVLLVGCACTFARRLNGHCEWYAGAGFLAVAAALTAQKVLERTRAMLAGSPPPWLRKALAQAGLSEARRDFEED